MMYLRSKHGSICRRSLCLMTLGLFWLASANAQVVIHEVMADNRGSVVNETEFPDWVELRNNGTTVVDLGGWSMTDNLSRPTKYVFPPGILIQGGEHLLVWLDDSYGLPGLHAGFGLENNGELLALYDTPLNGGALRDLVVFGLQLPDISLGRIPQGVGPFVLNQPTPLAANLAFPVGSTTNLFINEWMADDGPDDDWLELYNSGGLPVALGGLVFTDQLGLPDNRPIPPLSFIGADGYIQFIADNLDQDDADHLDFRLSAGGETVTLYEGDKTTVIDRVTFGPQTEAVSEGRLPDGDANRIFFPVGRDTPAASNFIELTDILFNELLSHTDLPFEDAVELINVSPFPVDISYWWLSDSKKNFQKFRVPAGTIIPSGGFKVFYEGDFNPDGSGEFPYFSFNSAQGDEVSLVSADVTGQLTGLRGSLAFGSSENGVAFGRHTNSQGVVEFVPMQQTTFGVSRPVSVEEFRTGIGAPNVSALAGAVVISEIMYHPPDMVEGEDNVLDEYIELYNRTNITVLLYDPAYTTNTWKLTDGVSFTFPRFVYLTPGQSLLVVNFDPVLNPVQLVAFRATYGIPDTVPIYGPFGGKLDNRGESLELLKPDTPQGLDRPDAGFVPYLFVDKVTYEDRDAWPEDADGHGKSLDRIMPEAYGNDPVHWASADPSPGSLLIRIESVARVGEFLALQFRALSQVGYTLQSRVSLTSGAWTKLQDFLPQATSRLVNTVDPGVDFNNPSSRFYRVVTPVQP